jgi:hypothetical protein
MHSFNKSVTYIKTAAVTNIPVAVIMLIWKNLLQKTIKQTNKLRGP